MSDTLSRYSSVQQAALVGDDRIPFGFLEWSKHITGVIPGKEDKQYQEYLKSWYKEKGIQKDTLSQQVKDEYVNLLKQLTLVFRTEAEQEWLTDIDFNNPVDIEYALPFYVRKLREIAIYLVNKREAIKKAKLKYNMVGAETALNHLFYEYLLKAFTKRQGPGNEYTSVTDVSTLNTLPELSAVTSNFQIIVEELYDGSQYFDRSPSLPASAYFTFNADVTSYLDTLNISPSHYEWLYNTGVMPICSSGDQAELARKYIGEFQYILTNGTPISSVLVTPDAAYTNLTNRHYSTIATMPYTGDLYSKEDVGGYFIPKMLGANTFIAKDVTTGTDFSKASATFRDPTIYNKERGLTQTDIITPITAVSIDNTWMKSSIATNAKAGNIESNSIYQTFTPYRTREETQKVSPYGMIKQSDVLHPWKGESQDVWAGTYSLPQTWKKQDPVQSWYSKVDAIKSGEIYKWRTDIFGNQYFVTKSSDNSIYDQREALGTLWIRRQSQDTENGFSALSAFFSVMSVLDSSVSAVNSVKDIDIWTDTMMIEMSSKVFIARLDFDYDANLISVDESSIKIIDNIPTNTFCDKWLSDNRRNVTLCSLLSSADQLRPVLRRYDIESGNFTLVYDATSTKTDLSSYGITSFCRPVMTYNKKTDTIHINTIVKGTSFGGSVGILQYSINNFEDCTLQDVYVVIPDAI